MLSKTILKAIDEQIAHEYDASQTYEAMACWCEAEHFPGFAKWLRKQSDEERTHARMFLDYILDQNESAAVPGVKEPAGRFGSLLAVFEGVKALEASVTQKILALDSLAVNEKDWQTHERLNWFVKEQVESEKVVFLLVARLTRAGLDVAAIEAMDREMGGD